MVGFQPEAVVFFVETEQPVQDLMVDFLTWFAIFFIENKFDKDCRMKS